MKVIFLDIDGVLNTEFQDKDEYGFLFNQECVNNLKLILENTGAWIVLSSTWRMAGHKVIWQMWKDRGLPGVILDLTTRKTDNHRGEEIAQWVQPCLYIPDFNYVILDDNSDMLSHQLDHFICVDVLDGLSLEDANRAIEILNKHEQIVP